MSHWPFIAGAYATAGLGMAGLLLHSFVAMRRAERQAERMKAERRR